MPKPSFDFDAEYEKIKSSYVSQLPEVEEETSLGADFIKAINDPSERAKALKAAFVGGANTAMSGFGDEITQKVLDAQKALSESDNPIAQYVSKQTGGYVDPGVTARERFKQVEAESPKAYLTGEIAGGLATPVPGLGKVQGLGKTTAILSAQGALQGLGQSEGETLGEIAMDTAVGAAIPAAIGGAAFAGKKTTGWATNKLKSVFGQTAPKAEAALVNQTGGTISKDPGILKSLERKVVGAVGGLSDEGVQALEKNPDALKRIQALGQGNSQEIIAGKASKIREILENRDLPKRISKNVDEAYNILDRSDFKSNTRPVKELINQKLIDLDIGGRGAFGEVAQSNRKYLEGFADDLERIAPEGILDGRNTKKVITQIRADIDKFGGFQNPAAKNPELKNALIDIQREFDSQLKDNIPTFRSAMETIQKDTQKNKILQSLVYRRGEGVDEDKIRQLIAKNASNNPTFRGSMAGKILEEETGVPLSAMDIKLKKLIEESSAGRGSNLTNLGAFIGGGLGGSVFGVPGAAAGAGVGASIGKAAETSARPAIARYYQQKSLNQDLISKGVSAKDIIQNAVSPGVSKIKQFAGTKFYPILVNAMKTGNYIATDFVLNTDPDYRKIKEESKKNGQTQ